MTRDHCVPTARRGARRTIVVVLLMWVCALASCGQRRSAKPHGQETGARSGRRPSVLGSLGDLGLPKTSYFWWSKESAWLRSSLAALRNKSGGAHRLPENEGLTRCGRASVILVADMHGDDAVRRGLYRLQRELTRGSKGRWALALEALPVDRQAEVDRALDSRDPAMLLRILRESSVWPILAYLPILTWAHAHEIAVLAAGKPVPDSARRTLWEAGIGMADGDRAPWRFKLRDAAAPGVADTSRLAAKVMGAWLQSQSTALDSPPRVIALFGAGHLAGPSYNIQSQLAQKGYSSSLVAILDENLEHAIRTRWPKLGWREWVQLGPGIFRAGVLRDEDWVQDLESRKRRFQYLVNTLPPHPAPAQLGAVTWNLVVLARMCPKLATPLLRTYANLPQMRFDRDFLRRLSRPDGSQASSSFFAR
jgi:hypothetical protein